MPPPPPEIGTPEKMSALSRIQLASVKLARNIMFHTKTHFSIILPRTNLICLFMGLQDLSVKCNNREVKIPQL